MYPWTEDRVGWYQRAVDYTGFDKKLASLLTPYLPVGETACDLGCGTGYLALELARRGYEVTAVDRSRVCLDWLQDKRDAEGLNGLTIRETDWNELAGKACWDHVVMAFAGKLDRDLEQYMALCRRQLILVVKTSVQSHVQSDGIPPRFRRDGDELEEQFRQMGLNYTRRDERVEFGQPLLSREEALRYLAAFEAPGGGPGSALERLRETGDPAMPLYLPGEKALAIFHIAR